MSQAGWQHAHRTGTPMHASTPARTYTRARTHHTQVKTHTSSSASAACRDFRARIALPAADRTSCQQHPTSASPMHPFYSRIHTHTYRSSSKRGLKAGHCARFRRCRAALSAGATTATARSAPCSQSFCFRSTPCFGSCSSLGGVLCCQLLVREPWPLGWSIGVGRLTRKQHGVSTALSTRTQTPQYTDTSTHLELDSFLLQKL